MRLQEVVAATLKRFKGNLDELTPENFEKTFCAEAKKAGLLTEACNRVAKHKERLSAEMQKRLATYPVRTLDELIIFLSTQLANTEKAKDKSGGDELILLSKLLIKIIGTLHNKEAKKIATAQESSDFKKLDQIKLAHTRWKNFHESYNPHFFDVLDAHGKFTKDDIASLVGEIKRLLAQSGNEESLHSLVHLLGQALAPSIAPAISDRIASLVEKLAEAPELLTAPAVIEEIETLISDRIYRDGELLHQKVSTLESVIGLLLEKLSTLMDESDEQEESFHRLKDELERIDFDNTAVEEIRRQLKSIHFGLGKNVDRYLEGLKNQHDEMAQMRERIKHLEGELLQAKTDANIDFLTKIYNKRALREFFDKAEASYIESGTDYGIIFIDIDFFKKINDTYGHHAGDVVLAGTAGMLKKHAHKGDIVGRFGGEEFIVLCTGKTLKSAVEYINAIRARIQKSTFLYKETKIRLTMSGGVALRSQQASLNETIKVADDHLYNAKKSGRNQVHPL